MYNKDLKLAFEYNGRQHYKFIPFFHKTYSEFLNLQENDRIKKKLCKKNGITLIIIPYTVKDLKSYIITTLGSLGFNNIS